MPTTPGPISLGLGTRISFSQSPLISVSKHSFAGRQIPIHREASRFWLAMWFGDQGLRAYAKTPREIRLSHSFFYC